MRKGKSLIAVIDIFAQPAITSDNNYFDLINFGCFDLINLSKEMSIRQIFFGHSAIEDAIKNDHEFYE